MGLDSLEQFQEYLKMCSDDIIWKPFYNDKESVDRFRYLIEKIEESKKWNKERNHEKGRLLEELVRFIMNRFSILRDISSNKSTTDNELDIFVNFNDIIPMTFLTEVKSKILCECKNMKSSKIDVGMVSKLAEVCKKNNVGLGIFISINGLTGKGWQYAEGKRRKLYLSEKIPIISFKIDEIEKLQYEGYNMFTMIKAKKQELVDEMEYDGGDYKTIENQDDFYTCINDNINELNKLKLITDSQCENIKLEIKNRYYRDKN